MKTTSAEHGKNNLLPYCGLIDAKIKASDKDLPVQYALRSQITLGLL